MNAFNFTFNIRPIVRSWDKDAIDCIRDLIDEGIAYWATDYSEEEHELPLLFVVQEDETLQGMPGPQTYRIDLATVASGINRILSGEVRINSSSIGNIAAFVATNDLQYVDCEDMDLIVQAGLYNDIKWG